MSAIRLPLSMLRALSAIALGSLVGWLIYANVAVSADRALSWRDLTAQIRRVEFALPTLHRFRKEVDYVKYFRRLELVTKPRLPSVDFSREEVVLAAVGPRSSPAYRVVVLGVVEETNDIVVQAREMAPRVVDDARPGLSFPFFLISLPRSSKPVRVHWQGGT